MPEPTKHALISPSKASRILRCAGSVALSLTVPEPPASKYAEDGTLAHAYAAAWLTDGPEPTTPLPAEMLTAARLYTDAILRLEPPIFFVEKPVNLEPLTGEPDAEGTPDAALWWPEDQHLEVWDLKTGQGVLVSPENNAQLMMYALALLYVYPAQTVTLVIHQPLVNPEPQRWDVSLERLAEFRRELATASRTALDLLTADAADVLLYLEPSEEACRWCPVKAANACPALEAEVMALFEPEPEQRVAVQDVTALTPVSLPLALEQAELAELYIAALKARIDEIRTTAADALAQGREVLGWKLVAGRRGVRTWTDPTAAEAALKAMRLKAGVMYDKKLITPPTAEKRLGPRRWAKMQAHITQSEGKAVVVRETDKRPALTMTTDADFENLGDDRESPLDGDER
jgi:hypothetical protein